MANNITQLQEATNIVDWLGVFNAHSYGYFVLLFILLGIIIVTVWQVRNQRTFSFAVLTSLAGFFIPALFFRALDYQGVPLISDAWIALHISLIAIFALIEFTSKS